MSSTKWVIVSLAAVTVAVWGGFFLVDSRDPVLKEFERLAKTHKLETSYISSDVTFDDQRVHLIGRFESATLTDQDKESLWEDFTKAMTPYGMPTSDGVPGSFFGEVQDSLKGSGRIGFRVYTYALEETDGEDHVVIMKLFCRTVTLDEIAKGAKP